MRLIFIFFIFITLESCKKENEDIHVLPLDETTENLPINESNREP